MDTVATTLTLAEQNHAEELKRVCLEFASRNLSTVMGSEGYQHMISSCPQLQVRQSAVNMTMLFLLQMSVVLCIKIKHAYHTQLFLRLAAPQDAPPYDMA